MSENTVESTETVETPSKDEFAPFDAMFTVLKAVTDDANADANKKKSLLASAEGKVDEVLNTSDDAKIVAYREQRAKAADQIKAMQERLAEMDSQARKYAESQVPEVDEKTIENLKTSYLAKRQKATDLRKGLLALLGNDEAAFKRALEAYEIVSVISSASGKTSSDATGIVRKRLAEAKVNGESVTDAKGEKTSFTILSNKTGIDGDEIRDAMVKASDFESLKDIPSDTTVSFSLVKGNETYNFEITTK